MCGPGGVGKGTIATRLIAEVDNLKLSRSWTTRARRPGEPSDSYFFVTRERFEAAIAEDGFLEWAEFLGNLYGTPKPDVPLNDDLLLEIDIQGAEKIRSKDPDALVILVIPPSDEVLRNRMVGRGDPFESIDERVTVGKTEVVKGRGFADHIIVNDDLDKAVSEISSIINALRLKRN